MDDTDAEYTLWCGNIPERVTEEILYELFIQAGPLQKVKIPKDRDNRQQSFGFVTFKHVESVTYAIALFDKIKLFGNILKMKPRDIKTSQQPQNQPQYLQSQPQYLQSQPQYLQQRQQPRYMLPKESNRMQPVNSMPSNDLMQCDDMYLGNSLEYDTFRNPNDMQINQNYNRRNVSRNSNYRNNDHWQHDNRSYSSNRHSNRSNNKRNRR